MHKLMIKTHDITGLKYLCYTRSEGSTYNSYKGSGSRWKKHLKKHGDQITTELIYETYNHEMFKKVAIQRSIELNIVDSEEWANLKLEEGDGGDTVSNKRWITNGIEDKYILKDKDIPEGWKAGRSKCVFNDSKKQKEFSSRVDIETRGNALKKAWDSGKFDKRDNTNLGCRNKDPLVKAKIRKANKGKLKSEEHKQALKESWVNRPLVKCPHCGKESINKGVMYRFHFDNCKYK